jgi:hypothetical protein
VERPRDGWRVLFEHAQLPVLLGAEPTAPQHFAVEPLAGGRPPSTKDRPRPEATQMKPEKDRNRKRAAPTEVRRELDRLMFEKGWEQASEIDWDDEDLAALRGTLSEEEFQTLLDEIDPLGGRER